MIFIYSGAVSDLVYARIYDFFATTAISVESDVKAVPVTSA